MTQPQESGATGQTWLWAPPAKRSSRQIEEVVDWSELLTTPKDATMRAKCINDAALILRGLIQ